MSIVDLVLQRTGLSLRQTQRLTHAQTPKHLDRGSAVLEALEGRTLLSGSWADDTTGYYDSKDRTDDHVPYGHGKRGNYDKYHYPRKTEATEFKAWLSGKQEVPPVETDATGTAFFELSEDGKQIRYRIDVNDIKNVVAAHLHLAPKGENGPIVVTLYTAPPAGGPIDGKLVEGAFTAEDLEGPLSGKNLSDLVALIKQGKIYVNVHTNDGMDPPNTGPGDFPDGEIRGQLYPVRTAPDDHGKPDDHDHDHDRFPKWWESWGREFGRKH